MAPSTHSMNSSNFLDEIEAMRDKLGEMEQVVLRGRLESLTPPPPTAPPGPDRHLLSDLQKNSPPNDRVLLELSKYLPGDLKGLCPPRWAISFNDDRDVVVETRIANATDLVAAIARLRSNVMRGGIYAVEALRDEGLAEINQGIWELSTERLEGEDEGEGEGEGDEITEEELLAFRESALPPEKSPVRQHWSSICNRAVSEISLTDELPAFHKTSQGLLPAMRTSFLLMAYHVCYFCFQGASLSSDPASLPHHLLQYARCAWSAQHIATHHFSSDERDVQDPVALSKFYYAYAREFLEELFDVPDVRTVESLMILSNVQAHRNPKQSSRHLDLAIYMAIECGLHRASETDSVCRQDGDEEVENGECFFGKTRGRCIWWLLYYYDSMRAIMGRSPPIIAQQLQIRVPTLLMPLDPGNPTARVAYFMCEMMKLTRIIRDFVITREDQIRPSPLETAVVGLRKWYDSVPELLRLEPDAPVPPRTRPALLQMRFLLDLHYYYFCLAIYAPFLLAPKEGEAARPHLRFYATRICARASEIVTGHILAVLALEKNPSYPQHLFSIDTILSGALVTSARVAEHRLIHAGMPRERHAARRSLERCAEALKMYPRVFSSFGQHFASKIDALLGSRPVEEIGDPTVPRNAP